jgi:hypothetical protein
MNEGAVFLIGIVIFAITIYGAVMAGGMALTKVVLDQEPSGPDGHIGEDTGVGQLPEGRL